MDPLNRKAMEPPRYKQHFGFICRFLSQHVPEALVFTSQTLASPVSELASQVGPVLRIPKVNQDPYLLYSGNCKPEKLLEVRCSGSVCL